VSTSLVLIMLIIPMYGITVLEGLAQPVLGIAPTNGDMGQPLSVPFCDKPNEGFRDISSSVTHELNSTDVWLGVNENAFTSRLKASLTSMTETLEKIQKIVDDLRMLVETLHQMTQTLIGVVNELSHWFDQVSISASGQSSV
jgi:hypothetical protein